MSYWLIVANVWFAALAVMHSRSPHGPAVHRAMSHYSVLRTSNTDKYRSSYRVGFAWKRALYLGRSGQQATVTR